MRCAALGIRVRVGRRPARRLPPRRPLRAVRCESDATSIATSLVKVKFTLPHHVEFGQSVCVLGSAAELGDWQVEKSPCLTWSEGDVWSGVVEVPPGELEYKYFTKNPDGSPFEWQPCENLMVDIVDGDEMEVNDQWDGSMQSIEQEIETPPPAIEEDVIVVVEETAEVPEVNVELTEEKTETVVVLEEEEVEEEESIPKAVQDLADEVVKNDGTANVNSTKEGSLSA